MKDIAYLIAAYAVAWVGLFIYLAVIVMRIKSVRTELAAVRELVQEQQKEESR
jgi:CcmD family protein